MYRYTSYVSLMHNFVLLQLLIFKSVLLFGFNTLPRILVFESPDTSRICIVNISISIQS